MRFLEKKKTKEELENMKYEELETLLDEMEDDEDKEYVEMVKKAKEACKPKKESKILDIQEEVRVGNIILEKGDRIEVLKEGEYKRVLRGTELTIHGIDPAYGKLIGERLVFAIQKEFDTILFPIRVEIDLISGRH